MIKICTVCKKEFKTSHSYLKRCSRKCSGIWKKESYKGENNPNWKGGQYNKTCGKCSVSFISKDNNTKYCIECRTPKQEEKPNWTGYSKLVDFKCTCCNKIVQIKQGTLHKRKYCSYICNNIVKNKQSRKKNTDIEQIIENWLIDNKIPYQSQIPLHGITLADFLVGNTVIFCDGDYWHSLEGRKEKDNIQSNKLTELGYTVIRLSETSIKSGVRPNILL